MMNKEGIGGALEREVHEVKYFRKGGNFFRKGVNIFWEAILINSTLG